MLCPVHFSLIHCLAAAFRQIPTFASHVCGGMPRLRLQSDTFVSSSSNISHRLLQEQVAMSKALLLHCWVLQVHRERKCRLLDDSAFLTSFAVLPPIRTCLNCHSSDSSEDMTH